MARFASKILNPKEVTRRLKGRGKSPSKQSGTPGGNIPQKSNKKPTSKPIDDEKGRGRGKFQKGSAPAPQNQNVSTRVEDDAADFVNKGGAGKVESRGDRMVRGTVGGGSKSSPEAGKEKARLQTIIRDKSKTKRQRDAAQAKLDKMRTADEAATDKARSSAAKTRRATAEKNRGKIKDPAGHFMQTGEIVEGFNPTPNQIKKANDFDKALALKEKQLADMRAKADGMKDRMNKIAYLADNKTKMDALKASIKDMKSRGGPGGRTKIKYKKGGGYMKKKMAGGGSLKMVEKNGKKVPFYAADGVGKMSKGGGVSKAMGEDRTRVPAEYSAKAQSKKPVKKKMGGGQVYKRKRGGKVVSGNDGNSIVAACYD